MSAIQVIVPKSSTSSKPKTITTTTTLPLRVTLLHSRLNAQASTPAEIISRSPPEDGPPVYSLRLGTVNIPDIPVEEIFDYVSEHDLEVFENKWFKRERDALVAHQIAQRDGKAKARAANLLRGNGIASRRASSTSSIDSRLESLSGVNEGATKQDGRRPRPSYTHLYKRRRGPNVAANGATNGSAANPGTAKVQVAAKRGRPAAKQPVKYRNGSPEVVIHGQSRKNSLALYKHQN